jgi:hypothetical protein
MLLFIIGVCPSMIMTKVLMVIPILFLLSIILNMYVTESRNILLNQAVYAQLEISSGNVL